MNIELVNSGVSFVGCEWNMLKQVFGKVLNMGLFANGGDKLRPGLYVPNTGFHNGQVCCLL